MENNLEKKQRVNLLMDCYEELLTDKQRVYLDFYYNQDLSLGEIADEFGVSRNAVFDNLKKAVHSLEKYETKLGLLQKHIERQKLIDQIEDLENKDTSSMDAYLKMLRDI
ncbi:YlxM family DNA-binding protein [Tannockella kyphosi]|uniref:YlxM family DNA-binding protein n=1 Tax=Tannockella kyphosi TaxID=2899121 RepID=UPI0020121321|nr:YlxM family DNA-binding protein [Tannockella kyphosi]